MLSDKDQEVESMASDLNSETQVLDYVESMNDSIPSKKGIIKTKPKPFSSQRSRDPERQSDKYSEDEPFYSDDGDF